jgi:Predicted nucleic acid-binding protein, consists of a PIN domain and a Zn-ribbon module
MSDEQDNEVPTTSVGEKLASAKKQCSSCGETIPLLSEFCPMCGLSAEVVKKRRKDVSKASGWLLVIAGLFAVFGTYFGIVAQFRANELAAELAQFTDDKPFEVPGVEGTYTKLELIESAESAALFICRKYSTLYS